ncbi:MAG: TRAP transporter small permease subunit [Lachnospiraceae bacterium]|nr:TRAP transporter small permease subunit [Lachnospiraceae bacterium]
MKKAYDTFCTIEELSCGAILCIIVTLAFATAIGRCIGHPISWTVEVSQFFLSWLAFLGADMALRHGQVLGVDLLTRNFPKKVQAGIKLLTNLLILLVLIIFVKYGIDLCRSNYKRSFQTVGISYSWATASLPFASVFMSVTMMIEILQQVKILLGKEDTV